MSGEATETDRQLVERLRNLVDNQTGGDALVLVQRQLFNKVVGRLFALCAERDALHNELQAVINEKLVAEGGAEAAERDALGQRPLYENTVIRLQTEVETLRDRLKEAEAVIRAAEAVCWFDWSENDTDAAAAIERLRSALAPDTANARLTAAAPELLEALKDILANNEEYARINNLFDDKGKPATTHSMKLAAAAIAKAEGRS